MVVASVVKVEDILGRVNFQVILRERVAKVAPT